MIAAIVIIAIIAVAAVGVVLLMQPGGETVEPIRIGILEPLTGGVSASGRGGFVGFQVAAQQLNEEGGVLGRPIVLIAEDTEGNPEKAASAATKLITVDNVDFLLGTILSSVVMQVAEVAADYETIFISTNPTTSAFTNLVADDYDRYKYLWRTQWNVSQWMFAWFDSFTSLFPDLESLCFFTEDLVWAREADTEMESFCDDAGIDYLGLLFTPGTTEFSAEIATLEDFGADIVLADLLYGSSTGFQKQWWDLQPEGLLVGASGILSYPRTIEELGPEYSDYLVTFNTLWNVSTTSKTQEYFTRFTQFAGERPFGSDSTSYDGLMILAQAIEAAGTVDTDAVITALESGTFVGARGNYEFMDNHQVDYVPGVVLQWMDEEATVLWPTNVATGTYVRPPWISYP
jgi:branched-chain amino acid transport system substrate-binding protein